MKERIDNFMKVARERYDGTNTKANIKWEQLYKELATLLSTEDYEDLKTQWHTHQQTLKLEQWDMDFGELLLGGDREEEVKGRASGGILNTHLFSGMLGLTPEEQKRYYERYGYALNSHITP